MRLNLMGRSELITPENMKLNLPSKKSWALVAMLAQGPKGGWSREDLSIFLWPNSAPEQARASLRQELAVLRKCIRPSMSGEPFVTCQHYISLGQDLFTIDTQMIEKIVTSGDISLYGEVADLAQGFFASDIILRSSSFRAWVDNERAKLNSLAIFALERVLSHEDTILDPACTFKIAQSIIQIDPKNEGAYRKTMRALHQMGRDVEVMLTYNTLCQALQQYEGALPSHETTNFYRELISRQKPVTTQYHIVDAGKGAVSLGANYCWQAFRRLRGLNRKN